MKRFLVYANLALLCIDCGATDPAQSSSIGDASADVHVASDASATADGTPGSAQTQGTVGGKAFSSNGALGLLRNPLQPGATPQSVVTVVVPANFIATCAGVNQDCFQGTAHPNEVQLDITISSGTAPLARGAYALAPSLPAAGSAASASFSATDVQCTATTEEATGGGVTVTAVDGSSITGNYQLDFPGGDHIEGQFSAPYCYLATSGTCGTEVGARPIRCVP